jgi:glycosyltransferase involved in cell wall biosynthesis
VDDGSTDSTAAIADRLMREYPSIIRVIHQPNGGHGEALNQGIRTALGIYFKSVDSDDRLDPEALSHLLDILRSHADADSALDLIVNDYVYDHEDGNAVFAVHYNHELKTDTVMTWETVHPFPMWKQFMIHSLTYRTALLRGMNLVLPAHTFYEDNLYIYRPLPYTKRLYYLHEPLYGYFIGRADQSVNDNVIIKRLDQVTNIATQMITSYRWQEMKALPKKLRTYMLNNLAGQLYTTSSLQYIDGKRGLEMNRDMWNQIRAFDRQLYRRLRAMPLGRFTCLPGPLGRKLLVWSYRCGRKMIQF